MHARTRAAASTAYVGPDRRSRVAAISGAHVTLYSNLPGYEKPVFFAKSKIAKFGVFFPNMISQVVFFSYDGTLSLSVSTDATYVTEPHLLNELFAAEVAAWKTELEKLD